jgi:hypothetical protein
LSKLNTLVGSVGTPTLELINKVPLLKTVFGRIFSKAKAYEVAKNGGRHSGTYQQAINMTNVQIEKSIKSLEKKISIHENKILNPEKYYPDFYNLRIEVQQANLIKHWPEEIKTFSEQKQILEIVLNRRRR